MTADLLVRGGVVADVPVDVVVESGTVVAVTPAGRGGTARRILQASGLTVLPGGVDAHVHFDEPGRTDWEGWATGSLAAAAGGVTTVVDMPIDSNPPTVDADAVQTKRAAAEAASCVDFALWGGLVPGGEAALAGMLEAGVVGFKAFLCESGWEDFPPCDDAALATGMATAARAGVPIAVHCEDPAYFGPDDRDRPVASEVAAVTRVGRLAARDEAALHVVHCSSAAAVAEAGRWPKTSVETCPQYLALNNDDALGIGADAVCCPPLRDESNRRRLLALTASGAVHSIASDHSPCAPAAKEADPPFAGIPGVQTTLSVLLSLGPLALPDIVRLRSAAAGLCALARKGAIAPGYDADLALVDLTATWEVGPRTLRTRHRRSPFTGTTLPGVVVTTVVRGTVVYEDGAAAAEPGGLFLRPDPAGRRRTTPVGASPR